MAPLLARAAASDRAFERLYRRHAVDVYRYAYAVLRNQADAEDVTQTTFMNAYRALERGEKPDVPHNWLIAIAHNVCRQRFRRQQRRVQEVGLDVDVADSLVVDDDDAPTPADITRALGHLSFNQRSALVMRELEGRTYAEIGELLGLSVSAVETLLFRARRALREQLEGSLTCGQAEQFLSKQLDGELARDERSQLRAHLRECAPCRKLARRQRAHRSALKALGAVPLPSSLASVFGGGGAASVATKVAAVVVASSVAAGGVGLGAHELLRTAPKHVRHPVVRPIPSRRLPGLPIVGLAVGVQRRAAPKPAPAASHEVLRTVARPVPEPAAAPVPDPPRRTEPVDRPQPASHDPAPPPAATTTVTGAQAPAATTTVDQATGPTVTVDVPQVVTVTVQLPPVPPPQLPNLP